MGLVRLVFCDCCFHSVCPLMDKDKKNLWKLPDESDWLQGNLDLALMCRAILIKFFNQIFC